MTVYKALFKFLLIHTTLSLEKFISENFDTSIVFLSSNFGNLDERLTFIFHLTQLKVIAHPENVADVNVFSPSYIIAENSNKSAALMYVPSNTINTRARFLVILQNNVTDDDVKCIFETFWSFYIYNVVAYVNWTVPITWYPYHPENHCGTVTTLVINAPQPYENKLPRYLQGCPINVTWHEVFLCVKDPFDKTDPGHFVRALDAVADAMDATVDYLTDIHFNFELPTPEAMETIRNDFKTKYIDMSFAFGVTQTAWNEDFEISVAYQSISCFFILPPRRKITGSAHTLIIFSGTVWVLIFVSLLSMVIILRSILKINFEDSFLFVIQMVLQGTARKLPKSVTKRLTFTLFLFYVVNLNWIYISQLSGVMSKPSYEPKISTLKELALSSKKLKFNSLWDLFFLSRESTHNLLNLRIQTTDGARFEEELSDFLVRLDHGFISSNTRQLGFKNPEKLVALTKDQILYLKAYIMVRKGFPFLDKVNDALLHINEAGLMSFWEYESQININKTLVPDYEDVEGLLSLDQIFSAFIMLGGGLALAIFVFVLELVRRK